MPMASARAAHSDTHTPSKISRERLVRLEVETETCPQVLLRVLGLLAQRWIVPMSISATCGEYTIALAVEIEALPPEQAEALVARIESIVMVRKAGFG